MKILTNYDFSQNQVLNMVIQKLATPPASATAGQVYYDTAKKRLFYYNGTKWEGSDALDAVMTGADIVSTINNSSSIIDDDNLSLAVRDAIAKAHNSHTIATVTGLQATLDGKVVKVAGKDLSTNDFTDAMETKLTNITDGANKVEDSITNGNIKINGVESVVYTHPAGTNPHGTTKADVGLSNVDNTSDLNKLISTATQTALNGKVDNSRVLTDVPLNAIFTDTTTTVSGKTGIIAKADIVALGIPASDTIYTHPITAGNKHIPTGGTVGQVLKNTASGTGAWQNEYNYTHPSAHAIAEVTGLQTALDGKVDDSQVLTNVPLGAKFTDTVTTVNGKTGSISKADIVALGIPTSDTTYPIFNTTTNGLTPLSDGSATKYLRADGTWVIPTDTKYTLPSANTTTLGGVKSGTDITVDASGNVSVVDDSHNHIVGNIDGLQTTIDGLATKVVAQGYATTAQGNAKTYTDTAITNLIGDAPDVLNTLHEIADALNDDPNFVTTITNMIGSKTGKYSQAIGNGTLTSIVVTHNLGSRNVSAILRQTASPYEQVITDVAFTTENTITISFAKAPALNEYTVTIIG